MSIVDHVNIPVANLERSRRFYELALAPLGYRMLMTDDRAIGFGVTDWNFGIVEAPGPFPSIHIAFTASGAEDVARFHESAVGAGGKSNGEPALRPKYGAGYFAAFVLDPDGHNVEAVFRGEPRPGRLSLGAGRER